MNDDGVSIGEAPSLRDYLAVIQLRKWSILGITALVLASTLFFSFRQTPVYESEAKVLVRPVSLDTSTQTRGAAPNLETERELVSSVAVAKLVAEDLGLGADGEDLLGDPEVGVATNTEILLIRYAHPDPLVAQRRAQSFARSYLAFRHQQSVDDMLAASEAVRERTQALNDEIRRLRDRLDRTTDPSREAALEIEITSLAGEMALLRQRLFDLTPPESLRVGQIVEPANLPTSPASPNHPLNAALGLLVGLALAVGLAFLRERLDDRLRGRADLEAQAGAPVLAVVPKVADWRRKGDTLLVTVSEPKSGPAEAYRTLRTGLLYVASQQAVKTVLVTSAQAKEGKTATVANLGVALAQAGKRVIVVSADLRNPRLHRFFNSRNGLGLTGVLGGQARAREALVKPGVSNLSLLPSGALPGKPAELLGSEAMAKLLADLRQEAEFVLLDTPPVLPVADPLALVPLADAVLLVADAERTSRGVVAHARAQLDQVQAPVIGAIINNFDPSKARAYSYYYAYDYAYQQEQPPKVTRGRRPVARSQETVSREIEDMLSANMWST